MALGWPGVAPRETYTKDEKAHPWLFLCSEPNCYFAIAADTEEAANEKAASHKCPYIGGVTHIGGSMTLTLVEQMWDIADKSYVKLRTDESLTEVQQEQLKGQLRGMAHMISLFMVPHFSGTNEIVKEIDKRYMMRQAGEEYETKGLGSRRYEPIAGGGRKLVSKFRVGHRVTHVASGDTGTVTKIADSITVKYDRGGFGAVYNDEELTLDELPLKHNLTEPEQKAIKMALGSGMFTSQQLADTYKVSAAVIDQIARG